MTTQVPLQRHIDDQFCSSCGGQGVTGDNLTLQQKDPSADQHGSLPMVVENCPSEQKEYTEVIGFEPFWSQCT